MTSTIFFKHFAIAFAVVGYIHATLSLSGRILGAEEAATGQFTFAASVRLDSVHVCGGSIIGTRQILTAAHCVVDGSNKVINKSRLSVRVGSLNQYAGGKIVYVSAVTAHPFYAYFKNDIAVLKLESELTPSTKLYLIPIAISGADQPSVASEVIVAGWGEQSSGNMPYKLQSTKFTLVSDAICKNAYADDDESTFCLAHSLKQGSCMGDAGNGAVYNNRLVGISTFIVGACGSRYPDVFVNVSFFASFIQNQMLL